MEKRKNKTEKTLSEKIANYTKALKELIEEKADYQIILSVIEKIEVLKKTKDE